MRLAASKCFSAPKFSGPHAQIDISLSVSEIYDISLLPYCKEGLSCFALPSVPSRYFVGCAKVPK